MISQEDRKLCDAAQATYTATPTWEAPGRCRAFLSHIYDAPVIAFEGTRPDKLADWMQDFKQVRVQADPAIGELASGFYNDVLSVMFRVIRDVPIQGVFFTGHSKGASEALIAAALWKLMGRQLLRVAAFEPARVGSLNGILTDKDGLITHCGLDPVPDLPLFIPHPFTVTALAPASSLMPVQCHYIDNVSAALAAEGQHA